MRGSSVCQFLLEEFDVERRVVDDQFRVVGGALRIQHFGIDGIARLVTQPNVNGAVVDLRAKINRPRPEWHLLKPVFCGKFNHSLSTLSSKRTSVGRGSELARDIRRAIASKLAPTK